MLDRARSGGGEHPARAFRIAKGVTRAKNGMQEHTKGVGQ